MKKVFTSAGIVLVILFLHLSSSFAQSAANANIASTIITATSISKTLDVNFGNVPVSGSAGSIILTPTGIRTATGGVRLPSTIGTFTAATFTISGQGTYTYAITLRSSPVTITNGGKVMTINDFTISTLVSDTLAAGLHTLTVGATLNIAANQPAGTYVAPTPFSVIVNYN